MMHGQRSATPEEALDFLLTHVRVNEDGCHVWAGAVNTSGYPQVCWQRQQYVARRLVFQLQRGRRLTSKFVTWDTCGNPLCMRLEHLRCGTKREMAKQKDVAGGYVGKVRSLTIARAKARTAKLGIDKRPEVMRLLSEGMARKDIAAKFNVRPWTVSQAIRRWDLLLGPWANYKEAA